MESWRAPVVPDLPGSAPEPMITDTARGELVTAAAGHRATLYACGITPYDATHIGHAATYLAWDLLVRAWLDAGHEVSYVQNITDVDDPLLERAARDHEDWRELADREIALFRSDMEALRVLPPSHYVGAVEALPEIGRFSQVLAEHGTVYDLDGDTYFARSADPAFGAVSGLSVPAMTELFAERGGDPARPGKKDPLDPLVWLAERPGEPSWESGFGRGRPGWHVECAAIATRYLGLTFDVQAGGSDLVFPHHEMSASHARAAHGSAEGPDGPVFARHYAHAGMVRLDGEKMSKSRGNLVFVSRLLAGGTDPMAIRLTLLAHHYAADWDWTGSGLAAADQRLASWRSALAAAGLLAGRGQGGNRGPSAGPASWPAGHDAPDSAAPGSAVASAAVPGGAVPGGAVPDGAVPDGAVAGGAGGDVPAAGAVLAAVRERLADDLDAPGALAAVDRWASAVLAASGSGGEVPALAPEAALVRDTVDALLGVAL